jgi:hypothetical protein
MLVSGLFIHLYGNRQDVGALVGHDIGVSHHMNDVLQVAFGKVREPFVPPAKDQDEEPLDDQADGCDDTIDTCNDTNQDPVNDTNEQLKTACIVHVREELGLGRGCSIGHDIPDFFFETGADKLTGLFVRPDPGSGDEGVRISRSGALFFNNRMTNIVEHQTFRGLVV